MKSDDRTLASLLLLLLLFLVLGLSWSEVVLPPKEDASLVTMFYDHGTSVQYL